MKGNSFWLTSEIVRIVDFCCVWGWCRLKYKNVARGQVGTCSVGLVGSMCQLTPFLVCDLLVIVLPVWSISILRNWIMRTCKKRSDRSNTRLDALLRDVRAVRKCGRSTRSAVKDFQIPFRILKIYWDRVWQTDVKSTPPTLSLNTGYIQQI